MTVSRAKLRYFDIIVVIFIVTLIISNLGSTKIVGIGPFIFDGGTILFPLAYILGDAITEVYGFRNAKRVILLGLAALAMMSIVLFAIQLLPAAPGWEGQSSYEQILGFIPRIVGASMIAYVIGELVNSALLAKIKVKTKGKYYWFRSMASSVGGQLLDTVIFSVIAFAGTMSNSELLNLMLTVYILKLMFEVIMLPVSYWLINALKKAENSDIFDDKIEILPRYFFKAK